MKVILFLLGMICSLNVFASNDTRAPSVSWIDSLGVDHGTLTISQVNAGSMFSISSMSEFLGAKKLCFTGLAKDVLTQILAADTGISSDNYDCVSGAKYEAKKDRISFLGCQNSDGKRFKSPVVTRCK